MATHKKKSKAQIEAQRAQASAAGKLGGRPPGSRMGLPEWFTSAEQMANVTGIPKAVIADAKRAGWPFYRNNRYNLQEFLKQYFREVPMQINLPLRGGDGRPEPALAGRDMKDHYAGLREKHRYEAEVLKLWVPKGEVRDGLAAAQGLLFQTLDRVFLNELPPVLQGLSAKQMRDRMAPEIEAVKTGWMEEMAKIERAEVAAPEAEEDGESESAGTKEGKE
jgi:hypothetical protein